MHKFLLAFFACRSFSDLPFDNVSLVLHFRDSHFNITDVLFSVVGEIQRFACFMQSRFWEGTSHFYPSIQGTCFREHSETFFAFCLENVYETRTASVPKLRVLDSNIPNLIGRWHYIDCFLDFWLVQFWNLAKKPIAVLNVPRTSSLKRHKVIYRDFSLVWLLLPMFLRVNTLCKRNKKLSWTQ